MPNLLISQLVAQIPNPTDVFEFEDIAANISRKITLADLLGMAGAGVTADNGLSIAGGSSNVRLGGSALLANTTILTSAFTLNILSSNTSATLSISNSSSGNAISGVGTSGAGVSGSSSSGNGGSFLSTSGIALLAGTNSGLYGADIYVNPTSTNTVQNVLRLRRLVSGTAANNVGGAIDFVISTTSGAVSAGRVILQWTNATNATRTSKFSIEVVNSTVAANVFELAGSGQGRLNKYGIGTFLDTYVYALGVQADGTIVEIDPGDFGVGSPGGSIYTVDNGLTEDPANNFQLGSDTAPGAPLIHNTHIDNGAFTLNFNGNSSSTTIVVNNTSSGIGIDVGSDSGWALYGHTVTGTAIVGIANTGLAAEFAQADSATGNATEILRLSKTQTGGTSTNGLGGYIGTQIRNNVGTYFASSRQVTKLTDVTSGSETSAYELWLANSGTLAVKLTVGGDGVVTIASLAGVGTRNVVVDASGVLSAP